MRPRLALALGAGAAVALGLAAAAWRQAGEDPALAPPPSQGLAASAERTSQAPEPPAPALPPSLVGTEVDGGFVVDADGNLVVTPDAIDLFDYYLSATGEETPEEIRARIEQAIRTRLPASAQAQALDLLDRYLAYREALRDLYASDDLGRASLERRLQAIRELRRGHFDAAEREVLFAAQEARWELELERQRVAADPELPPEEVARRLSALDGELPPEVREAREAATAATRLRHDEAALRAEGASDAEIHALREERFGPEAAQRLADLDRRRRAWEGRVEAWLDERAGLLDEGASEAEVAALRAERFSGPERTRVEALERLDDGA